MKKIWIDYLLVKNIPAQKLLKQRKSVHFLEITLLETSSPPLLFTDISNSMSLQCLLPLLIKTPFWKLGCKNQIKSKRPTSPERTNDDQNVKTQLFDNELLGKKDTNHNKGCLLAFPSLSLSLSLLSAVYSLKGRHTWNSRSERRPPNCQKITHTKFTKPSMSEPRSPISHVKGPLFSSNPILSCNLQAHNHHSATAKHP